MGTRNPVAIENTTPVPSLADQIASLTSGDDAVLRVVREEVIASNIDCSGETWRFDFEAEGSIKPNNGVTVTMPSPEHIIANDKLEIFGGAGDIAFESGGTVYASWWPTLADAVSAVGSLEATIIISKTETVSDDLTTPVNVNLEFKRSGLASVASTKTLTINSPEHVIAGKRQVVFGGSGDVEFTNKGDVSPCWFGAKGSDTSDDTAAFQAAIDSHVGIRLIVPAGNYYITSITAPNNFRGIIGSGKEGCVFFKYGSANVSMIIIGDADEPTPLAGYFTLENFKVVGGSNYCNGIQINNVGRFCMNRLFLSSCIIGFYSTGSLIYTVKDCTFQSNTAGVLCENDAAYPNNISFEHCQFIHNTSYGLNCGAGQGYNIRDCDFENNGTADNASQGAIIIDADVDNESGYGIVNIDGCWFESNNGYSVNVEACAGLMLNITNAQFYTGDLGDVWVRQALSVHLATIMATGSIDIDSTTHVMASTSLISELYVDTCTYVQIFGVPGNGTNYNSSQMSFVQTQGLQLIESGEGVGTGGNVVTLDAPVLGGNYTMTLPDNDGANTEVMVSDGSGNLTWATN